MRDGLDTAAHTAHISAVTAIKPDSEPSPKDSTAVTAPARPRSPAAERALAEAEARRRERQQAQSERPKELGGRDGLDPTRYGDWEVKGIASDF
jgi:hypothetical protein